MSNQLRKGKFIALFLTVALVLNLFVMPAYAVDTNVSTQAYDNTKADLSFVYLGITNNNTTAPTLEAKAVPSDIAAQFTGTKVLWVGLQVSNMSRLRTRLQSDKQGTEDGGLQSILATMSYDSRYLRGSNITTTNRPKYPGMLADTYTIYCSEDDATDVYYTMDTTQYKPSVDLTDSATTDTNGVDPTNRKGYVIKMAAAASVSDAGQKKWNRVFHDDPLKPAAEKAATLGDEPMTMIIFPFQLASGVDSLPDESDTPILQAYLSGGNMRMHLGGAGTDQMLWNQNTAEDGTNNLKNFFNLVDKDGKPSDGTIPLITTPEPLAYAGGTVDGLTVGTAVAAGKKIPAATGGKGGYTYELKTGTLPDGLNLAEDGTISGTPTKATPTAGTAVTITAKSGTATADGTVTFKVAKGDQAWAGTVAVTKASFGASNGKLTITPADGKVIGDYEYSTAENGTYTTCTSNEITGIASGTAYWIRLKENANYNASPKQKYTMTAEAATYAVAKKTTPTFTAITYGDAQPAAQDVVFTTTGSNDAQNITASLTGTNADKFELVGNATASNVAAGNDATFQIRPKAKLGAGTYKVKVKATSNKKNGTATVSAESDEITLVVNKKEVALTTLGNLTAVRQNATGNDLKVSGTATVNTGVDAETISVGYEVQYTAEQAQQAVGTTFPNLAVTLKPFTHANYTITGTPTGTGSVTDRTLTGIQVTTDPTNMEYEIGEVINLADIAITAKYDTGDVPMNLDEFIDAGGKFFVGDTEIISGTTTATAAMDGKAITVKLGTATPVNTTKKLKVEAAELKITGVTTPGTYTKVYDGTKAVDKNAAGWTAPVYETNGTTVDDSNAVYTLAQSNVGDNITITVTGLKVDGQAVEYTSEVAKGEITRAKLTATVKTAVQGSSVTKANLIDVKGLAGSDKVDLTSYLTVTDKDGATVEGPYTPGTYNYTFTIDTDAVTAIEAANANYTIDEVDTNGTITITAPPAGSGGTRNYTVTFSAGTNGTLSGNATAGVRAGGTVADVPTVTAKDGYVFKGWSLDGKTVVDPKTVKIDKNTSFIAVYEGGAKVAKLNDIDHMGYIKGYENGTFGPNANITRAEVAAIFARLLTEPIDENGTYASKFSDVNASSWYANYIGYMEDFNLLSGYSDGTFHPNANITREEFAALAARFGDMAGANTAAFADVKANSWAATSINSAAAKGWIGGYPDGTFRPYANITRAEVVSIVNRMLDRHVNAEGIGEVAFTKFTDVVEGHWAYFDIIEASNGHDYDKNNNKETWK